MGRARRPVRLRRGLLPGHLRPPRQALDDFAAISNVPSIKALTGLAAAPNTLGGAVWTKIWMTCALTLAFGVVFLVTRNGRADEEVGPHRAAALADARAARATRLASWLVNAALCVAVGAGVALVSAAGGLDPAGAGITGSLIIGASMTGVGLVARRRRRAGRPGGVHLARRQRARLDRPRRVLRAADGRRPRRRAAHLGLARSAGASRCSPGARTGGGRWLLLILLAAALLALAARLEARRDLGAGLLPERRGRACGAGPVRDPARAWRCGCSAARSSAGPSRSSLAALLFGSVVQAMTDLIADAGGTAADLSARHRRRRAAVPARA